MILEANWYKDACDSCGCSHKPKMAKQYSRTGKPSTEMLKIAIAKWACSGACGGTCDGTCGGACGKPKMAKQYRKTGKPSPGMLKIAAWYHEAVKTAKDSTEAATHTLSGSINIPGPGAAPKPTSMAPTGAAKPPTVPTAAASVAKPATTPATKPLKPITATPSSPAGAKSIATGAPPAGAPGGGGARSFSGGSNPQADLSTYGYGVDPPMPTPAPDPGAAAPGGDASADDLFGPPMTDEQRDAAFGGGGGAAAPKTDIFGNPVADPFGEPDPRGGGKTHVFGDPVADPFGGDPDPRGGGAGGAGRSTPEDTAKTLEMLRSRGIPESMLGELTGHGGGGAAPGGGGGAAADPAAFGPADSVAFDPTDPFSGRPRSTSADDDLFGSGLSGVADTAAPTAPVGGAGGGGGGGGGISGGGRGSKRRRKARRGAGGAAAPAAAPATTPATAGTTPAGSTAGPTAGDPGAAGSETGGSVNPARLAHAERVLASGTLSPAKQQFWEVEKRRLERGQDPNVESARAGEGNRNTREGLEPRITAARERGDTRMVEYLASKQLGVGGPMEADGTAGPTGGMDWNATGAAGTGAAGPTSAGMAGPPGGRGAAGAGTSPASSVNTPQGMSDFLAKQRAGAQAARQNLMPDKQTGPTGYECRFRRAEQDAAVMPTGGVGSRSGPKDPVVEDAMRGFKDSYDPVYSNMSPAQLAAQGNQIASQRGKEQASAQMAQREEQGLGGIAMGDEAKAGFKPDGQGGWIAPPETAGPNYLAESDKANAQGTYADPEARWLYGDAKAKGMDPISASNAARSEHNLTQTMPGAARAPMDDEGMPLPVTPEQQAKIDADQGGLGSRSRTQEALADTEQQLGFKAESGGEMLQPQFMGAAPPAVRPDALTGNMDQQVAATSGADSADQSWLAEHSGQRPMTQSTGLPRGSDPNANVADLVAEASGGAAGGAVGGGVGAPAAAGGAAGADPWSATAIDPFSPPAPTAPPALAGGGPGGAGGKGISRGGAPPSPTGTEPAPQPGGEFGELPAFDASRLPKGVETGGMATGGIPGGAGTQQTGGEFGELPGFDPAQVPKGMTSALNEVKPTGLRTPPNIAPDPTGRDQAMVDDPFAQPAGRGRRADDPMRPPPEPAGPEPTPAEAATSARMDQQRPRLKAQAEELAGWGAGNPLADESATRPQQPPQPPPPPQSQEARDSDLAAWGQQGAWGNEPTGGGAPIGGGAPAEAGPQPSWMAPAGDPFAEGANPQQFGGQTQPPQAPTPGEANLDDPRFAGGIPQGGATPALNQDPFGIGGPKPAPAGEDPFGKPPRVVEPGIDNPAHFIPQPGLDPGGAGAPGAAPAGEDPFGGPPPEFAPGEDPFGGPPMEFAPGEDPFGPRGGRNGVRQKRMNPDDPFGPPLNDEQKADAVNRFGGAPAADDPFGRVPIPDDFTPPTKIMPDNFDPFGPPVPIPEAPQQKWLE